MKKILTITLFVACFQQALFSQDLYFGFKTGWTKESYTLTEHQGNIKLFMELLSPTAMFHFKTIFNNRLELSTGLGFYNYGCQIGIKILRNDNGTYTYIYDANNPVFRSFTIPLMLGYSFPIVAGLSAKISSGINFDFYFDLGVGGISNPADDYDENGNLIWEPSYPYKETYFSNESIRFNVLLSNQIALEYCTKKNFCISLFAAYHAGLREAWNGKCVINFSETESLPVTLLSRGSYWHFGIELGYKLVKNREKKLKKE